ncbi:uncharacterized protein PFL1_06037 [Pseudozyma flocculosa PF-1]|uniref:Uncharacterized protein n=2 Tax=Pseudozyma flocculosa TaxID=84751 RepID=A0A5C3F6F7_9BASI|nr:uncharacterized protein PFL1_06037 [Pseudozyma flocculosa PF-1]EPQ26389.1 hypothetical protein PFL1_06037 [Pseudozyma flocculosa PF-1]SPO39019.1 uncharacterized protein PSFLO_04498 [Pseudozyma flocculosa]
MPDSSLVVHPKEDVRVHYTGCIIDEEHWDVVADGFLWLPDSTIHICNNLDMLSDVEPKRGIIRCNYGTSDDIEFQLVGKMNVLVTQPDRSIRKVTIQPVVYWPDAAFNVFAPTAFDDGPGPRTVYHIGYPEGHVLKLSDGTVLKSVARGYADCLDFVLAPREDRLAA